MKWYKMTMIIASLNISMLFLNLVSKGLPYPTMITMATVYITSDRIYQYKTSLLYTIVRARMYLLSKNEMG